MGACTATAPLLAAAAGALRLCTCAVHFQPYPAVPPPGLPCSATGWPEARTLSWAEMLPLLQRAGEARRALAGGCGVGKASRQALLAAAGLPPPAAGPAQAASSACLLHCPPARPPRSGAAPLGAPRRPAVLPGRQHGGPQPDGSRAVGDLPRPAGRPGRPPAGAGPRRHFGMPLQLPQLPGLPPLPCRAQTSPACRLVSTSRASARPPARPRSWSTGHHQRSGTALCRWRTTAATGCSCTWPATRVSGGAHAGACVAGGALLLCLQTLLLGGRELPQPTASSTAAAAPTCPSRHADAARLKYLLACGAAVVAPRSPWAEFWAHLPLPGQHLLEVDAGACTLAVWVASKPGWLCGRGRVEAWEPRPGLQLAYCTRPAPAHPLHTPCDASILTRSRSAVDETNRGHHLAEAAELLQADDALARRLGAAGAQLVARSLAPPLVQARWRQARGPGGLGSWLNRRDDLWCCRAALQQPSPLPARPPGCTTSFPPTQAPTCCCPCCGLHLCWWPAGVLAPPSAALPGPAAVCRHPPAPRRRAARGKHPGTAGGPVVGWVPAGLLRAVEREQSAPLVRSKHGPAAPPEKHRRPGRPASLLPLPIRPPASCAM